MADNTMKSSDFAKVSEIYFVEMFVSGIKQLQEVLGITRKIEKVPGQQIKTYKVTGTLESGNVDEGADIPLSKYKTEVADTFSLAVKKWRKQTTLEAINDKGYDQAVSDTDDKMIKDIQGSIRKAFFDFAKTGTGEAEGVGLQGALAQTWGQLKVLFEEYEVADSEFLYMVNPLDIADYLAEKDVTVQTAFGMTYVENFLGLYNVLVYSGVDKGKVIGTAKNNIILYFTNPQNSEIGKAFDFTSDATGLVGVHHDTTYQNLTTDTVAICGIALYAELIDHVVVGTIAEAGGEPVKADSVTLSQKTMSIKVGEKKALAATVEPAGAGAPTFLSDDPTKASVDPATGEVTAVAEGGANVTAACGGTVSEACAVTVSAGA